MYVSSSQTLKFKTFFMCMDFMEAESWYGILVYDDLQDSSPWNCNQCDMTSPACSIMELRGQDELVSYHLRVRVFEREGNTLFMSHLDFFSPFSQDVKETEVKETEGWGIKGKIRCCTSLFPLYSPSPHQVMQKSTTCKQH